MTAPVSPILCVGAAHWDMVGKSDRALAIGDDGPGAIESRPGGVALNIAVGLAAAQRSVRLCSIVGSDEAGHALIREVEARGVDCKNIVSIDGGKTDRYLAIEDGDGNLFAAIADARLLEDHADRVAEQAAWASKAAASVLLDANLPVSALRRVAGAVQEAGADLIANPVSPTKATRLEFLLSGSFAPTIIANLAEVNALLREDHTTATHAATALQARTTGTALVTDGARPIALATPHDIIVLPPAAVPAGASVTGAGDALLASFLAPPDRNDNPRRALETAIATAAMHMSKGTQT